MRGKISQGMCTTCAGMCPACARHVRTVFLSNCVVVVVPGMCGGMCLVFLDDFIGHVRGMCGVLVDRIACASRLHVFCSLVPPLQHNQSVVPRAHTPLSGTLLPAPLLHHRSTTPTIRTTAPPPLLRFERHTQPSRQWRPSTTTTAQQELRVQGPHALKSPCSVARPASGAQLEAVPGFRGLCGCGLCGCCGLPCGCGRGPCGCCVAPLQPGATTTAQNDTLLPQCYQWLAVGPRRASGGYSTVLYSKGALAPANLLWPTVARGGPPAVELLVRFWGVRLPGIFPTRVLGTWRASAGLGGFGACAGMCRACADEDSGRGVDLQKMATGSAKRHCRRCRPSGAPCRTCPWWRPAHAAAHAAAHARTWPGDGSDSAGDAALK